MGSIEEVVGYRNPDLWCGYAEIEMKNNRARKVLDRAVTLHPRVNQLWLKFIRNLVEYWISYAKFEIKNGEVDRARNVHGRAVDKFADAQIVGFPEFEEQCKETERARCINKRIMPKRIPKGREEDLYKMSVASENRYGDNKSVLGK
ncbi:crooked neck protein, putative / cell cycle protein [Thalictrum thalictroides]|uniref:Crooked neck protein, putative / cell cycle protein n=1 Tax=Thalictrum thalictroides TaxID=46969 RepID=A0A7J6WBS3_THATH|nr:crooked neck protein, putative / cell cycle protein [Thalictrum thalictroides]